MSKLHILNKLVALRELRKLYKNNYTESQLGFHALNNYIKWFEKEPNIKHVTVYTLDNDEWRKSGLYLIVDRYQLLMNSLRPQDDNLRKAMKLLDWSSGYKIFALPEMHRNIVSSGLSELNIKWHEVNFNVYRLPWQKALNFDIRCPHNFEIRPLDLKLAPIVNSNFHFKQAGSLLNFERLIKHNMSVGLFDCNNDELVAWCTSWPNGFVGFLYVKPVYRQRGFAELILKIFTRKLAELEKPEDSFGAVDIYNKASNAACKKIDCKIVTRVYHMFAFCVPKGMEWPYD